MERFWYALTETCLAFTVFRDDFNPKFVALFTVLLFLKSFHWLAEERVDYVSILLSVISLKNRFIFDLYADGTKSGHRLALSHKSFQSSVDFRIARLLSHSVRVPVNRDKRCNRSIGIWL